MIMADSSETPDQMGRMECDRAELPETGHLIWPHPGVLRRRHAGEVPGRAVRLGG